jgi:hypothetical protein
MSIAGLIVMVMAWLVQLAVSWKGKKEISFLFLVLYVVGCALLTLDGLVFLLPNLLNFLLVLLVAMLIIKIKK